MEKIKIIMDVDVGIDDTVAMCLALGNENFEVLGFTTVFGNHRCDVTTKNTLKVLEMLGRPDIPVAVGANRPLVKEYIPPEASIVHGKDGLGDMPEPLPEPTIKPIEKSAVQFMADTLRESDEPITLVPVGPLTNIATLIMTHPELLHKIKEVAIMGGTTIKGNASPVAEANIIKDAEAAYILFHSGLKIKMAGLDATQNGYIAFEDLEEFRKANWLSEKIHSMFDIYIEHYRERMKNPGIAMHDSLPLAWLIKPELVKAEDYYVTVDINGRYTYGMTVADVDNVMKKTPNVTVAMGVDRVPFIQMINDAIENIAKNKK